MSQPPYDPYGPPQQPNGYQQPPWTPPTPTPIYQQPVYQPPPVQHGRTVAKQRMGASTHSIHAILTLFTCGAWSPIWFLAWLFSRRKTVTRY